jgi:transposase
MGRGKRLSIVEQALIRGHLEHGMSKKDIAAKLNRSYTVVNHFCSDMDGYGIQKWYGPKPCLTERDRRRIFKEASRTGMSSEDLRKSTGVPVTSRRIRQVLNSSNMFQYVKRKSAPCLKPQHLSARLKFAKENVFLGDGWNNIVFSDEKKFNLDGPDGWQYYWHDLTTDEEFFSKRQSGGGSIMVWAGFSSRGKTKLAFLNGKQDSSKYTATLFDTLLPFVIENHPEGYIFQQDNASIHRSRWTKNWLHEQKITTLEWPALSPDLNPIENLWSILARAVYHHGRQFATVSALREVIEKS